MGFRPSADIAHVVMSAIADFPLPEGVKVTVYIDNIRFGGPSRSAVESAARQFVERAAYVGAVLNSDAIDVVEVAFEWASIFCLSSSIVQFRLLRNLYLALE